MANANKITVLSRAKEEVVCWKEVYTDATPNTELEVGKGLTLIVNIDGQRKLCFKTTTLHGLLNPGKTTKLFGGNKPYDKVTIYAIDQTSEFSAEWGLGGPNAIACKDKEYDVDCTAVAYGKYFYKVENFFDFTASIFTEDQDKITRDELREFLRDATTGLIKSCLAANIAKFGVEESRANAAKISEELRTSINASVASKGITVYNFSIVNLDYDEKHKADRNAISRAKMDGNITRVKNDTLRDDIDVMAAKVNRVDTPLIYAEQGIVGSSQASAAPVQIVVCPRCGEKNDSKVNYCSRCGEKLGK